MFALKIILCVVICSILYAKLEYKIFAAKNLLALKKQTKICWKFKKLKLWKNRAQFNVFLMYLANVKRKLFCKVKRVL